MIDWFVFTSKTAAMQRLADLVRSGHHAYVAGQIPAEKAGAMAEKMDRLYGVGLTNLQLCRLRKTGRASFRLLMLQLNDGDSELYWWLLRTDGAAPVEAAREKWRDALLDRISLTGYELVRRTRAGQSAPAFTWRYQSAVADGLRESLIRAIRTRRDDNLRQLIHIIWRTPGFAGSREQVKKMADLIRGEWQRSRGGDDAPDIPARLGYVRRIPDMGRPISGLGKARGQRRGTAP